MKREETNKMQQSDVYYELLCQTTSRMYEEREKTNKMQNQMFIIDFCLNMFRASLRPSSGDQRLCYCIWCTALVLLVVVGSGCGALSCRM